MHDLIPLTALGAATARADTIGTLTLTEVPDLALASVAARRGQEMACTAALSKMLKADLPGPGKSTLADPVSAVWMAPDQWMLMAAYSSHELLAGQMRETLKTKAAVTEQSDAWVCFDVTGEQVVDLSERLCAAPVRRMRTADAQRTTLHHMGCLLICLESGAEMRFIGPRSSAASLHHALVTAAQSVS